MGCSIFFIGPKEVFEIAMYLDQLRVPILHSWGIIKELKKVI